MTEQQAYREDSLALVFQSTPLTIIRRDAEIWLTSSDLARALGYSRPDALGRIFERNAREFTEAMTGTVNLTVPGNPMPIPVRIFSLRGAHLLGMFARTPKAAEFRRWVLDILDREARRAPGPAPGPVLGDLARQVLEPLEQQAAVALGLEREPVASAIARGLEARFGVADVRQVPAGRTLEFVAAAARLAAQLPAYREAAQQRRQDELAAWVQDGLPGTARALAADAQLLHSGAALREAFAAKVRHWMEEQRTAQGRTRLLPTEIMAGALGWDESRWTFAARIRIGLAIGSRSGWRLRQVRIAGRPVMVYDYDGPSPVAGRQP